MIEYNNIGCIILFYFQTTYSVYKALSDQGQAGIAEYSCGTIRL